MGEVGEGWSWLSDGPKNELLCKGHGERLTGIDSPELARLSGVSCAGAQGSVDAQASAHSCQ